MTNESKKGDPKLISMTINGIEIRGWAEDEPVETFGSGYPAEQAAIGEPWSKRQLFERAINVYGLPAQVDKTTEELGELITAIARFRIASDAGHGVKEVKRAEMIEELADAAIMIEQMARHYGQDEFDKSKRYKLNRLAARLGNDWGVID